ncbi:MULTISPECIES: UvrD-helicase domain-containing protein [Providencia]|nr:UvrD-helicase domain-containing protein [Providencia sp. 23021821]
MSQIILSQEQEAILTSDAKYICCQAYAGSGKTFILTQLAKRNPDKRILYLAYNKGIQTEASQKFPSNTKVITTHAMAYRYLKNLKFKMKFNFNGFDVARLLNITSVQLQFLIIETLNNYYRSADYSLQIHHVPTENTGNGKKHAENIKKSALENAKLIFELQADPKSDFPAPPDFYIKYFQLVAPPLHTWFDIILFDEAQDANLVTKALLDKCECKRIFVGDTHQMINRWRGANDALDASVRDGAQILRLTTSYRFGRCVAAIANAILMLKGETVSLKTTGIIDRLISKAEVKSIFPRTVISRTNLSVLINAIDAGRCGKKVFFVGGIDRYALDDIADFYYLYIGNTKMIKRKAFLYDYPNWDRVVSVAENSGDNTLKRTIHLIENEPDILELVDKIKEAAVNNYNDADLTLVTAHSSKGLEWEYIEIDDDYVSLVEYIEKTPKQKQNLIFINDELNLLYVAVTRATKALSISMVIMEIILLIKKRKNKNIPIPIVTPTELFLFINQRCVI